ncbi:hypothetical protein [Actinoplanes sp. CA-252034]|uniref:hypothetical protein n=1 Tax=Actinoplanes sp. CA-252034 TaxID=3239906 RepID=UPI003D97E8F2
MIISRKYPRAVAPLLGLAGVVAGAAGAASAAPDSGAVRVSVERTRGERNLSIFQVSGGIREAGEVLRLVSSPAFRGLRSRYVPADRSGRYRYEVTVHYRNDEDKRVVTYSDTESAPPLLFEVIRKVETFPTPVFPPGFPFS